MIEIAPLAIAATDLAVGAEPLIGRDVRLSLAPPAARYSLRARDAAMLSALVGRPLPARIGEMAGGIACLGPDEWLAVLPAGETLPLGEGQAVSVVDVSDRGLGFVLEGRGAAAAIASGCPLDLELFAVGRATRTVFETVEVVLFREDETRFRVEVWRSFAPWLWHAFAVAIAES